MAVSDWYEATLAELLDVLTTSDPGQPVWGWGPHPTIGFWERRMVIETGIHRWDAEQAIGDPAPLTDHVAVSGLDEFSVLWLPFLGEVAPLTVEATDLSRRWVLGDGEPTETVIGPASEVFLRLMSRPSSVVLPQDWASAVDGLAPPPKPDRSPRE
jgi:uncharacterized protein (TIGR03083 family)